LTTGVKTNDPKLCAIVYFLIVSAL